MIIRFYTTILDSTIIVEKHTERNRIHDTIKTAHDIEDLYMHIRMNMHMHNNHHGPHYSHTG